MGKRERKRVGATGGREGERDLCPVSQLPNHIMANDETNLQHHKYKGSLTVLYLTPVTFIFKESGGGGGEGSKN